MPFPTPNIFVIYQKKSMRFYTSIQIALTPKHLETH